MENNNGQGLPLNLIVLAIVAALVLVLVIAFTIGGAGTAFGRIGKTGTAATGEEIDTIRAACRQACSVTQNSLTATGEWTTSAYCGKTLSVDLDGDGTLEPANQAGQRETGLKCWQSPIAVGCSVSINTPTGVVSVREDAGSTHTACMA
jgi:hypothetical protein